MSAKIISAFPACGKSTYYKEWSQYSEENIWRKRVNGEQVYNNMGLPVGEKILDSDSSLFSWIYDENGNKTNERNPDFPNNYIRHIKKHMETDDIIFVSSHKVVRDALKENDIPYILIYPSINMKDEWIRRFKERGNDKSFIEFQKDHWDEFITDMMNETYPEKIQLSYDIINVTLMNSIMDYKEN
jgi:hypothetical protein